MLLPYLDQNDLYQRFHLDEPWDSEHNIALLKEIPDVLRIPGTPVDELNKGLTPDVAPLTTGSLFGRLGSGIAIKEITDGTSNTLMIVETTPENSVPWTRPDDLRVADDTPLNDIAGAGNAFRACMCDGSAHSFPDGVPDDILKAMLSIDGGEILDWDQIHR